VKREEELKKKEARPLFFEGFGIRDEFEAALCQLERSLELLSRWDGRRKVNLELEDPSRN
jgi:hypothetical protein